MSKASVPNQSMTWSSAATAGEPTRLTGHCELRAGLYPWRITVRPNWIHFLFDYDRVHNKACAALGAPGLWKKIQSNGMTMLARDVAWWVLDDGSAADEQDASDSCHLEDMLRWAGRCLAGESDPIWVPPADAWVKEAIPRACLTVRIGGLLWRIAVVSSEGRLALRCVAAQDIDAGLERWRMNAIELLAMDASMLWGMARFGFEEKPTGLLLVCEVDLTGAPRSKALFRTAADAVAVAVGALLETADVVSDARIDLQSIGDCWLQAQSTEEQKGETE
ncbi:MAG: hypothetical protein QHJ82_10840 [Verrucomicrobiota bacterium]|nr:hypothetical protein [Verrucomicrobiota bacterium]